MRSWEKEGSSLGVILYIIAKWAFWELVVGMVVAHIIQAEVKLSKVSWRRRHLSCICGKCGRAFIKNKQTNKKDIVNSHCIHCS